MKEERSRYSQRGVSFSKREIHEAIKNVDKGLFPRAFCKVIPDLFTGDDEYSLIIHADGAGTKSALAYMYWQETGDISVFRGIAQDALVMNIDDILCVAPSSEFALSSTIGRNAHRVGGEVIASLIKANEELVKFFAGFGIRVVNTGGETADVGDLVRTIIVDSTVVCRVRRSDVMDFRVSDGQVIVGLASDGKADYEQEYNSGIGSNGLSSARHEIFHHSYREKYPETYSCETKKELVYNGKFFLEDLVKSMPVNMGKAVLSPTRTYAPVLLEMYSKYLDKISGVIHCTGGGQTKCLNFGEGIHYIKDNLFCPPPIFSYIQESSLMSWEEMYSVFNMGHRMEIICDGDIAEDLIAVSRSYGIEARIIGRVEKREGKKNSLTIKGGKFSFSLGG